MEGEIIKKNQPDSSFPSTITQISLLPRSHQTGTWFKKKRHFFHLEACVYSWLSNGCIGLFVYMPQPLDLWTGIHSSWFAITQKCLRDGDNINRYWINVDQSLLFPYEITKYLYRWRNLIDAGKEPSRHYPHRFSHSANVYRVCSSWMTGSPWNKSYSVITVK